MVKAFLGGRPPRAVERGSGRIGRASGSLCCREKDASTASREKNANDTIPPMRSSPLRFPRRVLSPTSPQPHAPQPVALRRRRRSARRQVRALLCWLARSLTGDPLHVDGGRSGPSRKSRAHVPHCPAPRCRGPARHVFSTQGLVAGRRALCNGHHGAAQEGACGLHAVQLVGRGWVAWPCLFV